MKKLFKPAIVLMNRLKYPQKFILISFFFILPLALVLILLIPTLNERIEFTQKEIHGNTYLRPLRRLLEHSLQNKIVAYKYLNGDRALREAWLNKQAQIDEDFRALEAVDRELGDTLKTTESLAALQARWQALKNEAPGLEASAKDERYNEFISAIRATISLIGSNSHLILDPDLESYYLMDTLLLKLPEGQELLAQLNLLGVQNLDPENLTPEQHEQLIVLTGLLQANLEATKNSLEIAFQNSSTQNLELRLANPLQKFSIMTETSLETFRRELIVTQTSPSQEVQETYSTLAGQSLATSFNLWDQITLELEDLLQARLARFNRRIYVVGITTGLGLLLAAYLWVGFYLAVMRTVSHLDKAAQRMVGGVMNPLVSLPNQDELGQVTLAFNKIATALVKAQVELEQRVEERTAELSRSNEQLKSEIVERKRAETALQESQTFLRDIYTGVGVAIFVVEVTADGAFRYIGVNPTYEQMVGLKSADLEGRTLEELKPIIGAEAVAEVRCNYEQCLQAGQIVYKENYVVWQGRERWYLDQLTPIYNAEGQISRLIGSTVDTTQIKQIEKALRQSQQQYETLVNSIDGIVWEADATTFQFSFVSRQVERLLGYPVERWLTEPNFWADHIHPEDRTPALDFCLAATRDKRDHQFEYRMVTADGRPVWLRDIVTVMVENNQPVTLRGIMVDITERKGAEETLNRYAGRLEVLHEIDRAILAARSPEEIAQKALRYLRQFVPCQRAGLSLFDFETAEIVILAVDTEGETRLKAGTRLPLIRDYIIKELQQSRIFEHTDIQSLSMGNSLLNEGIRGGISLPLIANEALIGLVNLWTAKAGSFSQEHVNIAREVADQLAIAIQQARLFEAEAQRRQEAEALRDTAAALNSTLNIDEILERILRNIDRVVPHDAANIMLIESGVARIVRGHGYAERGLKAAVVGLRFTVAEMAHQRQMIETGRPVVVRDAHADLGGLQLPETRWVRSYIGAPLQVKGQVIGFLFLDSAMPGFYTPAHAERLQAFADQAAVALENARLHTETEHRAQELAALNKASRAMTSTLQLNAVLNQAMNEVKTLLKAEEASVLLYDPAEDDLVFAAVADPGPERLIGQRAPLGIGIVSWVMQTGQPVLVNDTQSDPRFYGRIDAITGQTTHSLLVVPLIFEETAMGVVEVINKCEGTFDIRDLELLEGLANTAALAIKNARLYAETEQRAEHLAVLHELDQAITASLDIDDVYRAFAQQALRLLPFDRMSIGLVEGDQLYVISPAEDEGLTPVKIMAPLKSLAGTKWVIEQGKPLLSDDISADQRFSPTQRAIAMGLRSTMILPLRIKGRIIGAWFLGRQQLKGYQANDLRIAQSMADQLAIALENVRLFGQVQRYAGELEQRVADRTRELSALYEVTAVASESLDLPTTLERSLERVLGAMRSQVGMIHLLDEAGETLHLRVQQGLLPDLAARLETLQVGVGLQGWVIKEGAPLIVPDVALDPRAVHRGQPNFQSYIGVPMRARGQIVGVLSVARAREQSQFNVEEVALLTTIADQVGVVVESARLRHLAERSAVMEERARLARDLHDSVTQLLYSLNLFAAVGRGAYNQGDMAQVSSCLNDLEMIALQALKEMRLLVYELRPLALAQEGLVGALQQRLDAVERRANIQTHLQADINLDLPRPVEEALYHITQEALNNALKHSGATTVAVRLETAEGRIELEITDNGSGFDSPGKGGLGLVSMRERVENLGGILTILSASGEGTKVRVSLEVQYEPGETYSRTGR